MPRHKVTTIMKNRSSDVSCFSYQILENHSISHICNNNAITSMVMRIITYFMEAKEIQFCLKMIPLRLLSIECVAFKFIEQLLVTYEKHFHTVCSMGITFRHRVWKRTNFVQAIISCSVNLNATRSTKHK